MQGVSFKTNNTINMKQQNDTTQNKKGSLNNLIYNIILPLLCLFQLPKLIDKWTTLDIKEAGKLGLVIALAFPIIYFIYYYVKEKKTSFMSIIGIIGILFTGLVGLLELPREYIAIERATIPLIFALVIIVSNFTSNPIVKKMLHNSSIFNTEKIDTLIKENGTENDFEKTLNLSSYMFAGTFLFSSICNYFITQHYMMDLSMEFTDAYAKVKTMSMAITIVPLLIMSVAIFFFYQKRLVKHTGVQNAEELYSDELKDKESK